MTTANGILSVRQACDGGDVADKVTEIPDGWFGGAPHIVLLVHGFNNSVQDAFDSFSSMTNALPDCFPKIGWFYWPGDANLGWFDFLDFASYPTEIKDAQASAALLAGSLTRLAQENENVQITLVGHSLGCRLICESLKLLAPKPSKNRPKIKSLLFMAAALPVELMHPSKDLGQSLSSLAPNGYVFHSTSDRVLHYAFPAGQTLAFSMGYEDSVYLEAVGRHGNPIDLFSQMPQDRSGNRHGDYWSDPKIINQLKEIAGLACDRETENRTLAPPRDPLTHKCPKWTGTSCRML